MEHGAQVVVDGYRDLVAIGEGGFAVVYRATQVRLGQRVALKVLQARNLDDKGRRRFEAECEAMGSLGWHPHVVTVHDSGFTRQGHPYLVMEYLEQGSMADRMTQAGPLGWADAVDIGVQIAGALGAVHAAGRVHRDIKPENLLVGPFGEAKLADFGIAAVSDASHRSSKVSFTPHYVAPEVLGGEPGDARSDIYALTATLHALIAGRPPFASGDGSHDAIGAVLLRVVQSPPPRLEGVPDTLADLLERGLAKDPAARPQTASDFGAALQAIQRAGGQPVTALRVTPTAGPTTDPERTIRIARPAPPPAPPEPVPTVPPIGDPAHTLTAGDMPPPPPVQEGPAPSDRSSGAPADARREHPEAPVAPRRSPSARRVGVLAGAVLAVLLLAVVVLARQVVGPDEPGGPEVTAVIAVDRSPTAIAAVEGAVWVVHRDHGFVTRIDPDDNRLVEDLDIGSDLNGTIAASADAAWVARVSGQTALKRIDARNNGVTDVGAGLSVRDIASAGSDDVWGIDLLDQTLHRIDGSSGEETATLPLGGSPRGVAATTDAVWVALSDPALLLRVDPATAEVVTRIDLGSRFLEPSATPNVAATEGDVWVVTSKTDEPGSQIVRVDASSGEVVAVIDAGRGSIGAIAADGDEVWAVRRLGGGGEAARVDPTTDELSDEVALDHPPSSVAVDGDTVWVTSEGGENVTRIDPAGG